jgi:MFS family permease
MCGIGLGLNFMATQPLIPQWFQIHRAVAMGLSTAGVGAGGLIFILTTRLALANHGVRFAYVMNGIITFVILTPTTIFLRRKLLVISHR